jgi:hypothetical protein
MNSDSWEAYAFAEDAFYSARAALVADVAFRSQLSEALRSPEEAERALRLLSSIGVNHEFALTLLPNIIDLAVDGPMRSLALASQVLAEHFSDEEVLAEVSKLVGRYLATNDYFLIRRLAQVLVDHHLYDLLATTVTFCRAHDDFDVREVADDFDVAKLLKSP